MAVAFVLNRDKGMERYSVCLMRRCRACACAERLANLLIDRGADVNLLNEKVRCSPRQFGTGWRVGACAYRLHGIYRPCCRTAPFCVMPYQKGACQPAPRCIKRCPGLVLGADYVEGHVGRYMYVLAGACCGGVASMQLVVQLAERAGVCGCLRAWMGG